MRRVFLAVPKAAGRCKRYQMPDQLHSETELCELLVPLLLANGLEVLHLSEGPTTVEKGLA